MLFAALFQGPIKDVLVRTPGPPTAQPGMRIVLNIAPGEQAIGALPWEFLYDPDQGPLAMLDTSIVRYLQQSALIPTLKTSLPLKVLLTGAQPQDMAPIEVRARARRCQGRAGSADRSGACAAGGRAASEAR